MIQYHNQFIYVRIAYNIVCITMYSESLHNDCLICIKLLNVISMIELQMHIRVS